MDSRRILITGLSSNWGGRLAQALEREPEVEAIIGVDSSDPRHELDRTEFVRVDMQHALIRRIVKAAAIDTVVDTRLVVDPLAAPLGRAHEINALGTTNILAACSGSDSPIRKFVFKSSADYYGCESGDPAFFTEEMTRPRPPRTAIERDIVDAEAQVAEFAVRNRDATVTVLRVANGIGFEERTSHLALLALPIVPTILGFDPRCQFIHEEDIVGVLEHAVRYDIPGVFNAAADGVLALSEVVSLLGKPMLPVLPPWGTTFAASQLRRAGVRVPVELLRQLRFGRGLDNRRLKACGYRYRYTTREAVVRLRAHQRLRPLLRSGVEPFQYEREVEDFLRWSPSVQSASEGARASGKPSAASVPPLTSYDDLSGEEVIEVVTSLEVDDLEALARYETSHRARRGVLAAIDRSLARKRPSGATP
ncbi:MAG TPA: NAD-dependent epimerase/dehydratase family protein [Solirubrobacteraceae bacterium]|jgi:UDP-glucose 4-epimerase